MEGGGAASAGATTGSGGGPVPSVGTRVATWKLRGTTGIRVGATSRGGYVRYRARVQMHQLVARTIDATGVPSPVVRQVITAFIQEVKRGLIEDGSVSIERFGRMRLVRQKAHVLHRYTKEGTVATPVPFRIHTSSVFLVWRESASSSGKAATVGMFNPAAARMIRIAISPRLAMSNFI